MGKAPRRSCTTMTEPTAVPYLDPDTSFRSHPREIERERVLMGLIRPGESALDIGARDGYYSVLLAQRFAHVASLDLAPSRVHDSRVECVAGDATALPFPDRSFDLVFCAEVLEHIPDVERACREIVRVTRGCAVICTPFNQDLRVGRMRCQQCGCVWGPWKHLHSFTLERLESLFHPMRGDCCVYTGSTIERTTWASAALMDFAGHPWGTYHGPEPCACGAVMRPPEIGMIGKAFAFAACMLDSVQRRFIRPAPDLISVRFEP